MKKIYSGFCRFEEILCGTTFIALIASILLSAGLRAFNVSVSWNIDIALLLLAWTSFLGADCAFRQGQLIGIDLFTRKLEPKRKIIVEILVLLFILTLLIILLVFGIKLCITDSMRQYGSLPISFSWAVLSLPFMAFSMSISAILKIRERFGALKSI